MTNVSDTLVILRAQLVLRFELPVDQLAPETRLDDLGLDALDCVDLVLCLEEECGVAITDQDLVDVHTLGDLERLIEGKLAAERKAVLQ